MAGIYIHIPFCRKACTYCNFHFSTSLTQKENFVQALLKEISLPQHFIDKNEPIDTIYFGGGTPSLLSLKELHSILDSLYKTFHVEAKAEITLEANPDDITRDTVKEWMAFGINRLSLGVQSFNENELAWMNRSHSAKQALQSIDIIRNAGISNFSVDLIFGSPLSTDADIQKNVTVIIDNKIPHVSCYALTVENKTALHHHVLTGKSKPVDPEKQAAHFLLVSDLLSANVYEHYEISNYALPGFRSQHNSSYWKNKPYHGFGPSAHSFNGKNKRRWNISNNTAYINQLTDNQLPFEEEILTEDQQINEYIMTALRTMEGIDSKIFSSKFGNDKLAIFLKHCEKHISSGRLITDNARIILSREGKLFADGIAADLFF